MSGRSQAEADEELDMDEKMDSDFLSDHNRNYVDIEPVAIDGTFLDAERSQHDEQRLATLEKSETSSMVMVGNGRHTLSSRANTERRKNETGLLKTA